MSGTSLDGISTALARFTPTDAGGVACELLHFSVEPYSAGDRRAIMAVINSGNNDSLFRLNVLLGERFADAAQRAITASGIGRGEIAAIASHGQTIWHIPGVATLQVGEAAVIAERSGLQVVSDFRVRDVAAGGEGAPLVPIADMLLFASATQHRALQNIGGIANVCVVPPAGNNSAGVVAFDTGPGVVVIDGVVERLSAGAERMDRDGKFSDGGHALEVVVEELMHMPFFAASPPKSTGRELFTASFVDEFIQRCKAAAPAPALSDADIVATAVRFTSKSIADAYRRFVPAHVPEVLLSGGGSRHPQLRRELETQLAPMAVRDFASLFFDAEAKEAVAFALLGYLHLTARIGNVPAATGAAGGRVLGKLTPA
jgi:anhydro-N-acetylmuramic acid kinase